MSHIIRFDHVGVTVRDLDLVTAFFVVILRTPTGRASIPPRLGSWRKPDP